MRTKKDVLVSAIIVGSVVMGHAAYYFMLQNVAQQIYSLVSLFIIGFEKHGLLFQINPWDVVKVMILSGCFILGIKLLLQFDLRLLFPKKYAKDAMDRRAIHSICFAPPRSGKGATVFDPNLLVLLFPDSTLARDIKKNTVKSGKKTAK